ncbi:MAG: CapA family protein [Pseudomonadota bacterium]
MTGGTWEGLVGKTAFSGASVGDAQGATGELYFALSKENWSPSRLATLQKEGVIAAVVSRHARIVSAPIPLLRVNDPREALHIVAQENAKRAKAKRILVTGTEGKTGLKFMLHHIMNRQMPCHAVLNSANLHIPIWRSMASIRSEDEYAIIEVSVAQPNRGWQRSKIIRPHLCVITNISPQHTIYHGTMDRLIRHKAESVTSILPGGVCFINADNDYYLDLKDAIQRIKTIPVLSFGSSPWCEGRLISANFILRKGGWQVQARIFGRSVNYFVSMVNSYAPLASVSALTIASYLGLDLEQACASLVDYHPFETAGRIINLPLPGGEFTLFDHSLRGSLAGFRSASDDLERIAGKHKVRMVLGAIRDLGEHEREPVHRELAALIHPERVEKIYTVGDEMRIVREAYCDPSQLGPHGDTWEEIAEELFNDIRPGDVVFIKGHHRVWLSLLVKAMEDRFQSEQGIGAASAPAAETSPVIDEHLVRTLIAGGDVMLSRDIPGRLASAGIDSAFREIHPLLERADIALANLECVISGRGDFFGKGEGRPYFYRCPPAMVNALVAGGISALTTANNHAMDFGPEALADQARILAEAGVASAGSGPDAKQAAQPVFLKAGDLVVAVISFATDQPLLAANSDRWGIFQIALDREAVSHLKSSIEAARLGADLIIASPHWGENWKQQPSEDIRRLAWALIDLGVDAVLGHSAHIVQGIEVYRGRPIVYDMGSLLFDRVQQDRMRHSALFELAFGPQGIERLIIYPVELEPGAVRHAGDEEGRETLQLIEKMSRKLDPAVEFQNDGRTLELRLEPQSLTERILNPDKIFEKCIIHRLEPNNPVLGEANIFHSAPPADIDAGCRVDLGGGLAVLGASFPERGRAGAGFVLEVYFCYPETQGKRWRASVLGINPVTGEKFRYRHPVAEGMWVPQEWHDERIISDRIIVRPPADLAPAHYDLYWNLVDADTGKLRKTTSDDPRIRESWVYLGTIELVAGGPRVVAGMSLADSVPIRQFSELSVGKSEVITGEQNAWDLDGIWDLDEFILYQRKINNTGFINLYKNKFSKKENDFEKLWWVSESQMLGRFAFAEYVIDWSKVNNWLDLGCGTGDFFKLVLENKGKHIQEIVGVDATKDYLEISSAKVEKFNLKKEFRNESITEIDLNRKFDLITFSGILQTLDIQQVPVLMDRICSHLSPGGQVWFDTLNYGHFKQRKYFDLWTFKTDELIKLFEHYGFQNIRAETFDTDPEINVSDTGFMLSCYGIYNSLVLQEHNKPDAQLQPVNNTKLIAPPALVNLSRADKSGERVNQDIAPLRMTSPEENAMAGLRRLSLDDLPRYKAALAEAKRTTWQHYFPFLYLYSATAKTEHIWISEEGGSLCVYRRNLTASGPILFLASLPMPMNMEVLEGCLARIREHNQSQAATIYWVDEEDLGILNELGGITATPYEPDYLYDPKIYKSLSGSKTRNLRKNLTYMRARNDVEVRAYTQDDLGDCLALLDEWAELQKDKHDKILYQRYTRDCLKLADQFESRDLFGKVVLIDGKIRSFGFAGEMRPGLGNLFLAYSDHRIKGINYFLKTQLMMAMEDYELVNDARADSPGLEYAKESMCPVAMHNVFRVKVSTAPLGEHVPEVAPKSENMPGNTGGGNPPAFTGKLEKITGSVDTNIYIAAAKELGLTIEVIREISPSLCRISKGSKHLLIEANSLSLTSTVHRRLAYDKFLTLELLEQAGVPCPKAKLFRVGKEQAILEYVATNRPVVVKPKTGSFGKGVCINPQDDGAVLAAVREIRKMKRDFVQVESYIEGYDYRVVLYDDEIIGITKWIPPHVIGDGIRPIKELIEARNAYRIHYSLSKIAVEEDEIRRQGFDYRTVLPKGISCELNRSSSYLVGGETTRIDPALIHPDNLEACRRAAEATYLNFSGIDLISKNISVSYRDNGAAINEINTCPNIFVHYFADMSEDTIEARRILQKYFGE